jgi:hypothetical protein
MSSKLLSLFVVPVCFAVGCGGGSSSSSGSGGTGGVAGGGGTGGGSVAAPTVVTLAGGQNSSGVDIAVATPASTTPPNAESVGIGNSAANTRTTIPQGSTQSVILFGPGLSANMTVSLTGPADITVSNIQAIMSTTNVPGISFTAAVSSSAALGARTVILQATNNNDITTFAGGLEVVP